jgi:hypothetical protein
VKTMPVSVLTKPGITPPPVSTPLPEPAGPPDPGPAQPSGPPALPDATTIKPPDSVTLGTLLSPSGMVIPLTCTSDCTVDGTLSISSSDLKSLTAVVRNITLGKGSIKLKAGAKGKLRIKLTKKFRTKLKIALKSAGISARRKIKLNLTVHTRYRSGKKKTIRRKIILRG